MITKSITIAAAFAGVVDAHKISPRLEPRLQPDDPGQP
jgi:hypothetical protein